jgi:hypothetical protein
VLRALSRPRAARGAGEGRAVSGDGAIKTTGGVTPSPYHAIGQFSTYVL